MVEAGGRRLSAAWYLSTLLVSYVIAAWSPYLVGDALLVKGQNALVVLPWLGFLVAAVLWWLVGPRRRASGLLAGTLIAFAVSWAGHLVLALSHGDNFNHTVWLVIPTLALMWLRPPTSQEGLDAIRVMGWSLAAVLVMSRLFEIVGVMDIPYVNPNLIAFDKKNYWLPLSGYLGVDGRWPGPFGGSAEAGLAAAFVLLIGLLRVRRWESWLLVLVGVLGLLLTGTRSAYMAALIGLAVLLVFANWGFTVRIPRWVKLALAALGVTGLLVFVFLKGPGTTGRSEIWVSFLDLWKTSPIVGVGTTGIMTSGGTPQDAFHAHNFVVDDLTRYGVVGLTLLMVTLALMLLVQLQGALVGFAGPLALAAALIVSDLTNGQWGTLSLTAYVLALLVGTAAASDAWTRSRVTSAIADR